MVRLFFKLRKKDTITKKLILEKGNEILHQFEVLDGQTGFNEKLYSSSDPDIRADHDSLFTKTTRI